MPLHENPIHTPVSRSHQGPFHRPRSASQGLHPGAQGRGHPPPRAAGNFPLSPDTVSTLPVSPLPLCTRSCGNRRGQAVSTAPTHDWTGNPGLEEPRASAALRQAPWKLSRRASSPGPKFPPASEPSPEHHAGGKRLRGPWEKRVPKPRRERRERPPSRPPRPPQGRRLHQAAPPAATPETLPPGPPGSPPHRRRRRGSPLDPHNRPRRA